MSKNNINIHDLQHYMFTKNHIMNLCFDYVEKGKKHNLHQNISHNSADITSFFIPKEKDTLFWCYYIIVNGIQNYEMLFNNTYKEEKQQKINFIEKMRHHKDILKKYKFKKTELEADLAYSNVISIKSFLAMCAIENKNIAVLKNRCLYTLISNDSQNIDLVTMSEGRFGCLLLDEKEKTKTFNEYTGKYWLIDNISKPLSGKSCYKLLQLQNIAKKLNIPLVNENGKKLKKIELYNLINEKI